MANLPTRQVCDGEERPLPLLCDLLRASLAPVGVVGAPVVPGGAPEARRSSLTSNKNLCGPSKGTEEPCHIPILAQGRRIS